MRHNKNLPKPIMWLSEVHRLQARMVSQKQSRGLYKRLVKSENKSSSNKKKTRQSKLTMWDPSTYSFWNLTSFWIAASSIISTDDKQMSMSTGNGGWENENIDWALQADLIFLSG